MQIYLLPYKHKTYTNVPYAAEKDKSINAGFKDVKKYPGQIKQIPELKNNPELKSLVETINKCDEWSTFGVGLNWDPMLQAAGWHEFSSYINLFYYSKLRINENEQVYLDLVGSFLTCKDRTGNEATTVEFTINPTNFHDFERFAKGVKPKEDTVLFRGFTLNINIKGLAEDPKSAVAQWQQGVANVESYFTR